MVVHMIVHMVVRGMEEKEGEGVMYRVLLLYR